MRRIPARLIIFVVPRTGTADRMAEHTAVCTGPNTNTNRGGQAPCLEHDAGPAQHAALFLRSIANHSSGVQDHLCRTAVKGAPMADVMEHIYRQRRRPGRN